MAEHLAHLARAAQDSGQVVRAYLLYAQAAVRDPQNSSYRANRDTLAAAASLLTKAQVEPTPDITPDLAAAREAAGPQEPPIERVTRAQWEGEELGSVPKLEPQPVRFDWDLHAVPKVLFEQVAARYGVRAHWDHDLESGQPVHFELKDANLRTTLEALTAATHSFVFPISSTDLFFAPDTETKRNELEPVILLTFPLPDALSEKDLIDASNAVRGLLNLHSVGWDSISRTVMVRDRATRARVARSLLEALLLPRGQLSLQVEFMTLDTDKTYHYGASLQTLYQIIDFGRIGGFKSVLPAVLNSSKFAAFGGGATLFGVGLADATAFASFSDSDSRIIFDATVVIADHETANLHIGDKYPIAQSLYTGFQQSAASIYNPTPQITMEDLGLVLKVTPHINGEGAIDLDLEAQYQTLGTQTVDGIPEIGRREFKGTVSLREGQWAVLAGMSSTTRSVSRTGLAGLASVPGLNHLLSENTRETQASDTLLVLKPTITRLPMTGEISPQYLLGPEHGERVLL